MQRLVILQITTIVFFASEAFYVWLYRKMGRIEEEEQAEEKKEIKEKENKIISQKR